MDQSSQESGKLIVDIVDMDKQTAVNVAVGSQEIDDEDNVDAVVTLSKMDNNPQQSQTKTAVDDVSDLVYLGRKRKFRRYPLDDMNSLVVWQDFSEGFRTRLEKTKLMTQADIKWDLGGKVSYCAVDCSKMSTEQMKDLAGELFEIYYTDKSVSAITFARNWAVFTACCKNKRRA